MTGTLCVLASIGGAVLDVQTVTAGFDAGKVGNTYGYVQGLAVGSISDGTFNPIGGASITALYWFDAGTDELYFVLNGTHSNAGWTNLEVGGNTYTRASATFATSGSDTTWSWVTATNPFPVNGNTYVVTFT